MNDPTNAERQRRWRKRHGAQYNELRREITFLAGHGVSSADLHKLADKKRRPQKQPEQSLGVEDYFDLKKTPPAIIASTLKGNMSSRKFRAVYEEMGKLLKKSP
jgi:hypothetical protein